MVQNSVGSQCVFDCSVCHVAQIEMVVTRDESG